MLATTSQCSVFAFGECYHEKVLLDDGLDLQGYFKLTKVEKESYDDKSRDLVSLRIIIQNSTSSRTRTYLKEQYYVNQVNYLDMVVKMIALITSFGSNSGRNGGGGGGGEDKNTEEPDAVVAIHLAIDSDDDSDYDDKSVESFRPNNNSGPDDGSNNNPNVPIAGASVTVIESENCIFI